MVPQDFSQISSRANAPAGRRRNPSPEKIFWSGAGAKPGLVLRAHPLPPWKPEGNENPPPRSGSGMRTHHLEAVRKQGLFRIRVLLVFMESYVCSKQIDQRISHARKTVSGLMHDDVMLDWDPPLTISRIPSISKAP